MDTIHRIVSRSLIDRSQKRNSKRLVADESFNDVNIVATKKDDWNLYMSNLNPNFEMLNCEIQYGGADLLSGSNSLLGSTEDGLTPSPNASGNSSSNASGSGDDEYNLNKLCIVDELNTTNGTLKAAGRERTIYKVSNAVRKKFSLTNPFSNSQKHLNLDADERNMMSEQHHSTSSNGRRNIGTAQNETKKLVKDKSKRKKSDKRILGWPEESENQQLLVDEADDD